MPHTSFSSSLNFSLNSRRIVRGFTVNARKKMVFCIKQEKKNNKSIKIIKNVKTYCNYLPVKLNDRDLQNYFHEILSETHETRF